MVKKVKSLGKIKAIKTIQYMGSKKKLLAFIEDSINDYLGNRKINSFYDAFSGSGRVAYHFSTKYKVYSSDKQHFSKVLLDAYTNSSLVSLDRVEELIKELNKLPLDYFNETDKWFTDNYSTDYNNGISIGKDGNPKIWLTKNAKKIDMIRHKIDDLSFLSNSSEDLQIKNVLILSLVLAINKICNTLGHQNGYLKKWAKNSLGDLVLENPIKHIDYSLFKSTTENYVGDIFEIMPNIKADLTYFDPPYGTNNGKVAVSTRYSSFYHLWNTVVKNDRPKIFGKAGKPIETKGWTADIEKNKKEFVIPVFEKLIEKSNSRFIAFSYSNHGLLTKEDFMAIFTKSKCFNIKCYEKHHKVNTQANTAKKEGTFIDRDNEEDLIEYFFIMEKKSST